MDQIETKKDCIKIMMAADEDHVIPLTVTALSLMDTVDKSRKVHIYVIDFDIRSESKTKITESLNEYLLDNSLTLEFLPIRDKDKNKVLRKSHMRKFFENLVVQGYQICTTFPCHEI